MSEAWPAVARGRLWEEPTRAAAEGRLLLQTCTDCGAVQYPPGEVCRACLTGRLVWRASDGRGRLLAATRLHASLEAGFRALGPLAVGSVALEAGPVVIAWLTHDAVEGERVEVLARLDPAGQAALVAVPITGSARAGQLDFDDLIAGGTANGE